MLGEYEAGYHHVRFYVRNYASGVYIYAFVGEGVKLVKKMMLVNSDEP